MQRHGVPTRALTLPAAAPARTAAPRAASLTLAFALILGGCGGGTTSSGGASPSAAPSTQSAASAGPAKHRHRRHRRGHHAAGAVAVAPAAPAAPAASTNGSWPCNDAQFTQDQQQFANGTLRGDQEVDVCGTVTQVLAAKTTSSGLHGYFYVRVAPGDTIEIVSDLGEMDAPAWPWVKAGDYAYVQGRYYYDSAFSQGIDWTHHGTSSSWPTAGYVVIDGTEYQ